jgi:hypothetical protein
MSAPTAKDRANAAEMARFAGLTGSQGEGLAQILATFREDAAKAERERVLGEVDTLASDWDKRSEPPQSHYCPAYESCIECPVFASYEYRADELRALAAKLRGEESGT